MKIVVPSACVVAGVAIGWFARPMIHGGGGDGAASTAAENLKAAAGSSGSKRADAPASTAGGANEDHAGRTRVAERSGKHAETNGRPEVSTEQIAKAQEGMAQRMTEMQRKKFEARLTKLVAELNLTPEQQQQVRDNMEKRFAAYGSMFTLSSDNHPEEKIKDTMALLKGDGVDEALSGMLQGDQLAKYEAVKVKDQKTRADAKALKNLSSLSTVVDDLSPTQKDAIYQAYNDEEMKNGTAPSGLSQMYEGMGVQMDDELGIQEVMEKQMETGGFGADGNHTDMQTMMKDAINKKVEDRIATLKPYLSETQLQQYRTHLEDKASGMMNMFGGAVRVDSDSHEHDTDYVQPKK